MQPFITIFYCQAIYLLNSRLRNPETILVIQIQQQHGTYYVVIFVFRLFVLLSNEKKNDIYIAYNGFTYFVFHSSYDTF